MLFSCKKRDLKVYKFEIITETIITTRTMAHITVQYTYPYQFESIRCFISSSYNMGNAMCANANINNQQFVVQFDNLSVNTEYYYYYEYNNGIDIIKTQVKHFVTKDYEIPTVSTSDISNLNAISATCGGSIIDDGGLTVSAKGVCWSTSQYPTISDSHTIDNDGAESFTSSITGLIENTKYYVRAYATNSIGTNYG